MSEDANRSWSFWGKSNADGNPHSLLGHLLDTAAVGELIWDEFMASGFKEKIDEATGNSGRDFFRLLCGFHDLGKASPAFQSKASKPEVQNSDQLLQPLQESGIKVGKWRNTYKRWPHPKASVVIADQWLREQGVDPESWRWALSLLEGHHGSFGQVSLNPDIIPKSAHGTGAWEPAQQLLAETVASRIGVDVQGWEVETPSRGAQLALAGFLIMADWIASSSYFPGLGIIDVSMAEARERAKNAWGKLGLARGWSADRLLKGPEEFAKRFGFEPRPLQTLVMEAISESVPQLMIIEAPMGEGKTEASFCGAELIAKSLGLSGITYAMPTQGTTDAMYARAVKWMLSVDPSVAVSLLHGKAMLNEKWYELTSHAHISGICEEDEFGMADDYGSVKGEKQADATPAMWLLGRHRGLLSPVAVGTVDQVLRAATRTRFVALRHAGLSGHVLIIDEVHSYEAFMSVFLHELIRWCARMGVPVILMSATLAPAVKEALVSAWYEGKGTERPAISFSPGYPSVFAIDERGHPSSRACEPFRPDLQVAVEVLESSDPNDAAPIADAVVAAVSGGGVALVILNTVDRAQMVWRCIRERGLEADLIHGRLTAAERAKRTALAVKELGVESRRPEKKIIVATQIAEQSFDVDADILFSDIAPIDLLLQRVGRLHRHDRPETDRAEQFRKPKLVVTGVRFTSGMPSFAEGFSASESPVYRRLPLLTSAAEIQGATSWAVPSQVPELVSRAYRRPWDGPANWEEPLAQAYEEEEAVNRDKRERAITWRLDPMNAGPSQTLEHLHAGSGEVKEGDRSAVVRDMDDMIEVVLVRHDGQQYLSLAGSPLGIGAERACMTGKAREVLGDSVRIRAWQVAPSDFTPIATWANDHMLAHTSVIVLNECLTACLSKVSVHYDMETGLSLEWNR